MKPKRVKFGRTGFEVSRVTFGGGEVGYLETEQERVAQILNTLLDSGVNVIDTAASYQESEVMIGKAIGHRRQEYVLVSKCGSKVEGLEGEPWSEKLLLQSVDRSLKRLKTDRIDVMLLHSCKLEELTKGEAVGALAKARDAGKVRFTGYSGDNEAAAYAAGLPDIAVIETSVNICDQVNIEKVLPKCREHDVGVMAKRSIANSAWKSRDEMRGMFKDYSQTYRDRLAHMKLEPEKLGFDESPQEAWVELALRFTLSFPEVHTAIIGTTNPDHARANIGYAEKGPLPQETVKKIREAFRVGQQQAGEEWTGQT